MLAELSSDSDEDETLGNGKEDKAELENSPIKGVLYTFFKILKRFRS